MRVLSTPSSTHPASIVGLGSLDRPTAKDSTVTNVQGEAGVGGQERENGTGVSGEREWLSFGTEADKVVHVRGTPRALVPGAKHPTIGAGRESGGGRV